MFKGFHKKAPPGPPAEAAHHPSAEEDLLKLFVEDYCYQKHLSLKLMVEMTERQIIYLVLEKAGGNQRAAARVLGVRPNTLHYKIQRMGLIPFRKYLMVEDLADRGGADKPLGH